MKIAKGLMPFLLIILAVICLTGCSHVDKTDVQAVITNELDLLKNLDSDTTQKYVSYKELFPDATKEIKLSNEVKEVFSLFFQNFDYEILSVNVDNDKKEATASLRLSTIDAASLAKDYGEASLKNAILKAADSEEQATEKNTDSMEERYLLLDQLLSNNNYATVERECTVELCNKGSNDDKDEWEIIRSHSLENNLVGGLMTYLSDNNLLSPEETLTVYLNTLKTMNTEQMGNYLGIESLFQYFLIQTRILLLPHWWSFFTLLLISIFPAVTKKATMLSFRLRSLPLTAMRSLLPIRMNWILI